MVYELKIQDGKAVYIDNEENVKIEIDEKNLLGFYETRELPAICDESIYENAVLNPCDGSKGIKEIAVEKKAKTACIIVSDATRNVPTQKVASIVVRELRKTGIEYKDMLFVVALGVHRDTTEEEMESFIGKELYDIVKIENHTPFDESNLIYLGKTKRNTPVKVNKRAYKCDIKITIGKVELHEMAGFSGGRKSILPGVSSEETIVINHRPEMIFNEGTGAGNLKGNPISEDMTETARMFGVDFTINFVVDNNGIPSGVFAGDLEKSHEMACDYLKQYVDVKLPKCPDVAVICPGIPLSCDFYQGVKALISMHKVIDSNTVVVIYGAFPEGMNSVDFPKPLKLYKDLEEARKYTWENYKIQMDHTLPVIDLLKEGIRVIVVSDTLSEEEISDLRMIKEVDVNKAVKMAMEMTGKDCPKIAFCPHPQKSILSL